MIVHPVLLVVLLVHNCTQLTCIEQENVRSAAGGPSSSAAGQRELYLHRDGQTVPS